jgi:hypothetical protein
MLLHIDGLNEGWQSGVPSYWEQEEGNGILQYDDMPQAIRRLLSPALFRGDTEAATTDLLCCINQSNSR